MWTGPPDIYTYGHTLSFLAALPISRRLGNRGNQKEKRARSGWNQPVFALAHRALNPDHRSPAKAGAQNPRRCRSLPWTPASAGEHGASDLTQRALEQAALNLMQVACANSLLSRVRLRAL